MSSYTEIDMITLFHDISNNHHISNKNMLRKNVKCLHEIFVV